MGNHCEAALTNSNFKNLAGIFDFRGCHDHNDAYVEDFEIAFVQVDGGKMAQVVLFKENPPKTRAGEPTAKHKKTPQEMLATDSGPTDPVSFFEEILRRWPLETRTSGPLYLAIAKRPVEVWYSKSRIGDQKLESILRTLATALNVDWKKSCSHSTRRQL